jgi:polyphosphate kinase
MSEELDNPAYYINRELSWMEFNRRVLEEAQDPSQPLLERVKFLAIFSSNLDEYFEIRLAAIKQLIEHNTPYDGPEEMSASEIFEQLEKKTREMVDIQYKLWREELLPALASHGIRFFEMRDLSEKDKAWAQDYFRQEVFPVLTPLAVDSSHPFPQLLNKSVNVIVGLERPGQDTEPAYAIIQLPRVLPQLIRLPRQPGEGADSLWLSSLIKEFAGDLFLGLRVTGAWTFRVTRNSDLYVDDEEAENLLRALEKELRKRNRGAAVRLEIQSDCPVRVVEELQSFLKLEPCDTYLLNGPASFTVLMPLANSDAWPRLKDRPFYPSYDLAMPPDCEPFDVLRAEDVLLHHPYESFDSVIYLLERASQDPHVLAIKITLYRTSPDSPIVKALIAAATAGKQVTAIVEIKARFDEENNIQWAKKMEEAGVHVVYGVVGLKTHCKVMMIVRRDSGRIRHYVHLGTGNYHPRTARIYTDLSLLTSRDEMTHEVATLFNTLTGLSDCPDFKHLLVAPFNLRSRFKQMIRDEAKRGTQGRIVVKINSLVEEKIIRELYRASQAGVRIDLIVRGVCCLRPGIPGVSENIRVTSIVGRFLEHSRIYYFANGGDPIVYLGSADWMPRNFFRRVEVAFPVLDTQLRQHICGEILPAYLQDRVKSRELQSDGSYKRMKPEPGQESMAVQLTFRRNARKQSALMAERSAKVGRRLVPVTKLDRKAAETVVPQVESFKETPGRGKKNDRPRKAVSLKKISDKRPSAEKEAKPKREAQTAPGS